MARKTTVITDCAQTCERVCRVASPMPHTASKTSLQFLFFSLRSFLSCSLSKQDVCVSAGQPGAEQHKADDQIAARWSCPVLPALWQIRRDLGPLFRYPLLNQHAAGQTATHGRSRSRRVGGFPPGHRLCFFDLPNIFKSLQRLRMSNFVRRKAMRLTKREMSHFLFRK